MAETLTVDVYEGDHRVYFESLGELFIEISNQHTYETEDMWRVDGEYARPEANEGSASVQSQFFVDMGEKVEDNLKIELVRASGELYVVGAADTYPAASPFYMMDVETEEVYRIYNAFHPMDHPGDTLLEIEELEDAILVQNVSTKVAQPVDVETFRQQLNTKRLEYVLPVSK